MNEPRITVLMPAFNAARYLADSVPSVLNQTLRDFEFLVIDDGSTDGSADIVRRFGDPRIRLVGNDANLGIAATLNRGLDLARGVYIARLDSDDVCLPERLSEQARFLDQHPGVGVVGSWVRLFGDQPGVVERRPSGTDTVRAYLAFDNPIFHPTAMLRRSMIEKHGLRYDAAFSCTEDYELWTRAALFCGLDNVPRVLLNMRCHTANITTTTRPVMTRQTGEILKRQLAALGIAPTEDELAFHHDASRGRRLRLRADVTRAEAWFLRMVAANAERGVFPDAAIRAAAGFVWFRLCRNCGNLGVWVWSACRRSPLMAACRPSANELARFGLSVLWNTVRPGDRGKGAA